MEDIGKTKWKKIKKDYARVCEYMKYDPIDDEVFVFYRYAKRLKRVDGGSRSESLNKQVIA